MHIAVACDGGQVAQHFGHCEGFRMYTVEAGDITGIVFEQNPGHKPGFLPNFLHEKGIEVIIAGGMGGGATQIFQEKGIHVVMGASGDAEEAVKAYIEGKLASTGRVCHEHQHGQHGHHGHRHGHGHSHTCGGH